MESSAISFRWESSVFRDTIYVIIILYSWHLVFCEHFWPYVWNNWSWVMHTMSTWFWHKNQVWHHEPVYHDSLHSTEIAQFCPQVGDFITRRWLRVSILSNVHILRCTTRRSPQSLSQCFPARKIFTLSFHHCGSHILHRPPLVPRLGDKHTLLPKSRK
jgi:hypothetical protein